MPYLSWFHLLKDSDSRRLLTLFRTKPKLAFLFFFNCLHLAIICFYISEAGDKNLPNANSKWRNCINSIVVVIHSE